MTTIQSFWESVKIGFKDGIHVAAEKTEEITRVGRIKLDIIGLDRRIDSLYNELGKIVYNLIEEEQAEKLHTHPQLQSKLSEISQLNKELKAKQDELLKSSKTNSNSVSVGDSVEHTD